jgi:hypothetical protein
MAEIFLALSITAFLGVLRMFRRGVRPFGSRRPEDAFPAYGPVPAGVPAFLAGLSIAWIMVGFLVWLSRLAEP